jgi:beta-xylosidase
LAVDFFQNHRAATTLRAVSPSSSGSTATDADPYSPIIPGLHPDPSVCGVGDDYYLACSSFEYFPGVPLFHSRDLLSWTQIGNALERPRQLRLLAAASSAGIYAPTLRHHAGRFWLATTNVSIRAHLLLTADDPAGPWSDPVPVGDLPGIDPDLAWDDEGTCWFTYSMFPQNGQDGGIMQASIDPRTGEVLDGPRRIWRGTGLAYPEAPHLYRINGLWYLLIAEGGTERGHAVSVARGPKPWGPFESCPRNPILSHRSTDSPVQSTGHADLVQTPDGGWHMVLLGTRPRGGTPAFHVLGRETFHTTLQWSDDGWPIPDPLGAPRSLLSTTSPPAAPGRSPAMFTSATAPAPETNHLERTRPTTTVRDDFDDERFAPQWISVRRSPSLVGDLSTSPGRLRLRGTGTTLDGSLPVFVGRRQQDLRCRVRALTDVTHGHGGLAIRIDELHHYEIEAGAGRVRCTGRVGPFTQEFGAMDWSASVVLLRVETVPNLDGFGSAGSRPDLIRLGIERHGREANAAGAAEHADVADFVVLAELDGRYLSTEVAGGFTGRVVGMFGHTGTVSFHWFEYQGWSSSV